MEAPATFPAVARGVPSVHAVVLNYRTPTLTATAVERLQQSAFPQDDLRIWVVDNGSADGSVEFIRAAHPDVPVVAAPDNLGFAGGNNLALRRILAELPVGADRAATFVLLLNSDTEVEPHALPTLVDFMHRHPEAGVVGPKLVLPDGSLDLACRRGFPTPLRAFWKLTGMSKLFPNNPRFAGYNLTHLDENALTEVDSVVGACMLVRVAAIDQAGLLDEDFFMYGEDLDWSYRIKQHGWKVYYQPAALVHHVKGASSRRRPYRMIYEFYRAMWLFHRKHYAKQSPRLLNWVVLAGIVARWGIAVAVNTLRPAERIRAG
ncbi:MAG: glycosyltransferase family 2 protein [Chloroflexi bacterium]|nr:MAG: glycosyltransferase family 2 protein [Chloroflexota bacterium]